jgi:xylulose-5-phosphate/fructose-6-phosphate phosphoketolase
MDVIDRVPGLGERAAELRQRMSDERLRHRAYTREFGEDAPDVREWSWQAEGEATAPTGTTGDPDPRRADSP